MHSSPDHPNEQEALEIRIVSRLLGELPPDEAAEVDRIISQREDLQAFRAEMEATLGVVREIHADTASAGKLDESRRSELLKTLTQPVASSDASSPIPLPHPDPEQPRSKSKGGFKQWLWTAPMALAAALVLLLALQLMPPLQTRRMASLSAPANTAPADASHWAFETEGMEEDQQNPAEASSLARRKEVMVQEQIAMQRASKLDALKAVQEEFSFAERDRASTRGGESQVRRSAGQGVNPSESGALAVIGNPFAVDFDAGVTSGSAPPTPASGPMPTPFGEPQAVTASRPGIQSARTDALKSEKAPQLTPAPVAAAPAPPPASKQDSDKSLFAYADTDSETVRLAEQETRKAKEMNERPFVAGRALGRTESEVLTRRARQTTSPGNSSRRFDANDGYQGVTSSFAILPPTAEAPPVVASAPAKPTSSSLAKALPEARSGQLFGNSVRGLATQELADKQAGFKKQSSNEATPAAPDPSIAAHYYRFGGMAGGGGVGGGQATFFDSEGNAPADNQALYEVQRINGANGPVTVDFTAPASPAPPAPREAAPASNRLSLLAGSLREQAEAKAANSLADEAPIAQREMAKRRLIELGSSLSANGAAEGMQQAGQQAKDELAASGLEAQFESGQVGLGLILPPTNLEILPQITALEDTLQAKQLAQKLVRDEKAMKDLSGPEEVPQTDAFFGKTTAPVQTPKPEVITAEDAFSTFSLNVSDVSFKLAAASLERGEMPDPGTVRPEEFLNAMKYLDPAPAPGQPVAVAWDVARHPFAHDRNLLRFSLQTAASGRQPGQNLNIVLLLDRSGSMERSDRVAISREAMRVLANQLLPTDRISVVAFARTPRLWVDALPGGDPESLLERVAQLVPEGGTNLEAALDGAYEIAARHFMPGGNNRVILMTDGAANLGNVRTEDLRRKVESWRRRNIALDCFGIGWDGYNDSLLEGLSRNGDGRYGFLNHPEAVEAEFGERLAGALQVAAADVKAQVEFNPERVQVWRQIGYDKHQLTKEQFRDNTVDAAEVGAAESGTALYSIQTLPQGNGPIGTLRVRYREPATGIYRELSWDLRYDGPPASIEQSTPALQLAGSAALFAESLAGSPYASEVRLSDLGRILRQSLDFYAAEANASQLLEMMETARRLQGR